MKCVADLWLVQYVYICSEVESERSAFSDQRWACCVFLFMFVYMFFSVLFLFSFRMQSIFCVCYFVTCTFSFWPLEYSCSSWAIFVHFLDFTGIYFNWIRFGQYSSVYRWNYRCALFDVRCTRCCSFGINFWFFFAPYQNA